MYLFAMSTYLLVFEIQLMYRIKLIQYKLHNRILLRL